MNDIPLSESAIERTDDIYKYLYNTLKYKKCCVCGNEGIVYTLNSDKEKMCLCGSHYDMAKEKGIAEFRKAYKVYGIQFIG